MEVSDLGTELTYNDANRVLIQFNNFNHKENSNKIAMFISGI